MSFEDTAAEPVHRHGPSRVRLVVGIVLLAIVVAVVFDNRGNTRVGYVFGDVKAPMVLVLAIAAVFGALIGWLLLHRPHHSHH